MTLLVVSGLGDVHVAAVAWAVQALGTTTALWIPRPPTGAPAFVSFAGDGPADYRFGASGPDATRSSPVHAVWLRRSSRPVFPDSFLAGDRKAARNELIAFHGGLLELL